MKGDTFSKTAIASLGKCERVIDIDIVQNQNLYVTSLPSPTFDPTKNNEKYCPNPHIVKYGEDNENNEKCKIVKSFHDSTEIIDANNPDKMLSQAGNLCPCGLTNSEDTTSGPNCPDFLSLSINGKAESEKKTSNSEDKGEFDTENTVKIDQLPGNATLPLTSTWPDYPLLVRRSPSSSSRAVSQCEEKFSEFIKPIKIHSNVEVMKNKLCKFLFW